ncbi:homocysteine-responsive endoplasmic reticulum-resident ubiquitin-like domain member 2 protein [Bacillus rossius redtenbacheri]|uniref:homocysteine-responsive endoplasmic reticulum-resident ubiquitin-like domain member 2 protein n=1 Tax=Bacillus rossius redtenbacheri TaxID=93214 RepID=UPI002FDE6383
MMEVLNMPVTLIVKAPNQQVEDLTIECELNWTIRRLKNYLAEVYPSKPRTEDQKLIYSGKLLPDGAALKDVLRSFEGQTAHTLHLVCATPRDGYRRPAPEPPRMQAVPARSSDVDEVRRRGSAAEGSTLPDPQAAWAAAMGPSDPSSVAQQLAWMQQAYANYMMQYMQLMASAASPQDGLAAAAAIPPSFTFQPPPATEQPPAAPNNPERVAAPLDNNPPDGEDDDGRGNRDWLDWFYLLSRMGVLLSIVYFYSSPTRFFMVAMLAVIMYMYHRGFLQVQAARRAADNNNVPAPAPDEDAASGSDSDSASGAPQQPERPSLLALAWTFFSSFFASLIPEQPGVL